MRDYTQSELNTILERIIDKHANKACPHGEICSVYCMECVKDCIAVMQEFDIPLPPLPYEI